MGANVAQRLPHRVHPRNLSAFQSQGCKPLPSFGFDFDSTLMLEEQQTEEILRQIAEQVAELALQPEDGSKKNQNNNPDLYNGPNSPTTRPEWQKICIQHSVCIHNIYGNCAYGQNCYYRHLDDFKKPDLLFKTELCRYGSDCVNRPRCCFAHSKKERRSPEQNVRDSLARNGIPALLADMTNSPLSPGPSPPGATNSSSSSPNPSPQRLPRAYEQTLPNTLELNAVRELELTRVQLQEIKTRFANLENSIRLQSQTESTHAMM